MSEFVFDAAVNYENTFAGDEKLFIKFETRQVEDPAQSLAAGRPIFKNEDWVNIMVPGDRSNVIEAQVDENYANRFARQYAKWKAQKGTAQEGSTEGTPLKVWPVIERVLVEELAYFHVHTVEQLLGMNDVHAAKFPGIRELQRKAKIFIDAAKTAAPLNKLAEENEKLRAELESNKVTLGSMQDQLNELRTLIKHRE